MLDAKYLRGKKIPDLRDAGVKICKGEYIILVDGENSGEVFLSSENGYMGSTFKKLHFFCADCIDYVLKILRFHQKKFRDNKKGGAIPHLDKNLFKNILISIPPLAEQKRIVAKIEELEPLVKQYEKAETELSILNDSFPEQLKKSILQYAIQGKLVPQDANDESAEILYAKIQAEKQKLIKEGKIKKDKPLPPITTDEIPFDIPSTWKWVRLGSISNYSSVKKKISPNQIKPEMWSLDLEDIEKVTGRVLKKHFAKDRIIRGEKVCFTKGNILYNKLRPYLLKILIADDDGITTPELVPFNFYGDSYQQFFLWYLKSPYVDSIVNSESYGVKMPRVGTDTMVQLLVPLPPSAEQKRIVTKINELMQYCEELKHPANKSNVEPITIEWLIDKGFASCQQNGYTDINAILDELDIAVMQDRNLKKGRIEYSHFILLYSKKSDNFVIFFVFPSLS